MTKVAIIGGFTALFTLTALALTSYHTEMRCHSQVGDTKTNDCPSSYEDNCPGAYAIFGEGTASGTHFEMSYKCPWKKPTAILGLIGLSLTQIFLGLLFTTLKRKAFKIPMVVLACLIVPILLASLGFMIRDLKRGFEYNEQQGTDEGFRPGTYLANVVLLFFGIGLIASAAFFGCKSDEEEAPANRDNANEQDRQAPALAPVEQKV